MKKIYSIAIILITFTIISCNNSSSKDLPDEYVNPGLTTKDFQATTFTINGVSSAPTPHAVIYQGTVNEKSQVGIVADNGSNFNLKIYWDGNIASSTFPKSPSDYKIKVTSSGVEYTDTASSLNITITQVTPPVGKIYTIQFLSPIAITGSITINSGNTITAYMYP